MTLFQTGAFTLRSGLPSKWKIECEALTSADWVALAAMAAERLPGFGAVVGVPRGGLPFAAALEPHARPGHRTLLVAEDVVTTGGSMARRLLASPPDPARWDRVIGVAAFARGPCPHWVTPVFLMPQLQRSSWLDAANLSRDLGEQ